MGRCRYGVSAAAMVVGICTIFVCVVCCVFCGACNFRTMETVHGEEDEMVPAKIKPPLSEFIIICNMWLEQVGSMAKKM